MTDIDEQARHDAIQLAAALKATETGEWPWESLTDPGRIALIRLALRHHAPERGLTLDRLRHWVQVEWRSRFPQAHGPVPKSDLPRLLARMQGFESPWAREVSEGRWAA